VGREWLIKTTLSLLPVDIISCGGMNLGLLWPVVFLLLPLVGGVSTSEELESSSSESSTILDDGGFGMGIGAEEAIALSFSQSSSCFLVIGMGMLRERRYLIFILS